MTELQQYIERAKASDYFSGYRLADDLERFLGAQRDACLALANESRDRVDHVYLVGSGGSLANIQSMKYLFDRLLDVPTDAVASYELIWRNPGLLGPRSLAVFASWSGETEDTVAALRFARDRGARTAALVRRAESTIGREADVTIPYESAALYEAPMVALTLFGARLASGTPREREATDIAASVERLPAIIRRVVAREEGEAEAKARAFLHATHLYVLGAGPLSPLAYKMAMSVIMENVRVGATYSDAVEFRHGPAEALERVRPDMLFLLGTDESRDMSLRTLDFCRAQGANVLVYDAADLGEVHPLLTPIVMNPVLQWFVVYSAILRGILDLDDRVFMGRQVLAQGGARWP